MRTHILGTIAAFTLAFVSTASADWSVDLVTEFSGATPPVGSAPWLRASFADGTGADAGDVFMHLESLNLSGNEFISEWYFNFDDSMDLSKLDVAFESGNAVNDFQTFTPLENGLKADGDGKYDFALAWANPASGSDYFDAAGNVIFRLSSTAGSLSAADFLFTSYPDGGHGPFVTAAHVQGIGVDDGDSGWVTGIVPIPGAGVLGVVGLGLVGWVRRKLV